MIKYLVKRLLLSILILLGVSLIIYALVRLMPVDYLETKYSQQLAQNTMTQEDIDQFKKDAGLYMPDGFLTVELGEGSEFNGQTFTRDIKSINYERVLDDNMNASELYEGKYLTEKEDYRLELKGGDYYIYDLTGDAAVVREFGSYTVNEENYQTTFYIGASKVEGSLTFRYASGGEKFGAVLGGYFQWLWNMMRGNLGNSFTHEKPVTQVIAEHMWISFIISLIALVLQFLIAIPMGITSATHQYSARDYTVTIITMIGISFPSFFFAALLIKLFSTTLGWFPTTGLVSGGSSATGFVHFADMAWHLVLPMAVLVVLSIGGLMRYTRTNMLEVLNSDYIRTARAKGLSEKKVIYVHAFRNTLIPLMTLLAGILPSLFGGAMITEEVFAIDGIGRLAYKALQQGDLPFIMGYNMFLAVLTVIGTLLSDIMYAVVDPRVKLTK